MPGARPVRAFFLAVVPDPGRLALVQKCVDALARSRKPEIVADAAYAIVTKDSRVFTGNSVIDDDVLTAEGVADMSGYAIDPSAELSMDILID